MINRYMNFLDKIAEKFNDKDKIIGFFKTYKWKIIILIFLINGLDVMYDVYQRGHCINCDNVTVEQIEGLEGDTAKLLEFTSQLKFIPYTNIKTYLGDLGVPLIFNWISLFVGLSILYIVWKILSMVIKKIRTNLIKNMEKKKEEVLNKHKKR